MLIPGGADKGAKAAGNIGSSVMNGFGDSVKGLAKRIDCNDANPIFSTVGKALGQCFVGDTLVVLDFAPGYQPAMVVGGTPVVAAEGCAAFAASDLMAVAGVTAILVGVGGAVAAGQRRRRREELERERSADEVFAALDRAEPLGAQDEPLPEVSPAQFDQLCDRLFAAEQQDWATPGIDVDVPEADNPSASAAIGRTSPACVGVLSLVFKSAPTSRGSAMTVASTRPVSKRRSTASKPARSSSWRRSLPWLVPWLFVGLACLGLAGFRASPPPSEDASPPVAQANADQPKYVTQPIRDVQVGTWVLADNPETEGNEGFDYNQLDPADLRVLRVRMVKPDGGLLNIWTLQSLLWLEQENASKGNSVFLEYEELGISGEGEILEILACPSIPPRPSPQHCLVTTKFEHNAAKVVDLYIKGIGDPIGATTNHPFWSEYRQEFVQAGELRVGETLVGADGIRTYVLDIVDRATKEAVYNLEVDGEHVYYVSATGVLVHNAGKKYVTYVGTDLDTGLKYGQREQWGHPAFC